MNILADVATLLAGLGLVQCVAGYIAVRRFTRCDSVAPARRPPVSILKPLCGDEPLLEEALASCCRQDYPQFQIVFGIQDPADPALAVVARIRDRFPDCDIALVIDSTPHGSNRKVANLINMLPSARHEVLLISDSDLHLPADYLARLVAELEKPGAGLVTSLYIGVPPTAKGWAARLGSTQISHNFLPGVLMSRLMGREDCLGSTAMLRRRTLDQTGGLPALSELLAEDNVLGQRVRDLGLSVRLADTVPAATVPEPSFRALWQHEIRWQRTIRELAPAALCASTIQFPLFWSLLAIAFSGGALWAIALFIFCWVVRAAVVLRIDHALRSRVGRVQLPTPLWLLPARDILSVIEIGASFWVDEVIWRGHRMDANGAVAMPVGPLIADPAHERI